MWQTGRQHPTAKEGQGAVFSKFLFSFSFLVSVLSCLFIIYFF